MVVMLARLCWAEGNPDISDDAILLASENDPAFMQAIMEASGLGRLDPDEDTPDPFA